MREPVKTVGAPADAWEVRMRWGDRVLEADVIDARKPLLTLGENPDDAFVIAHGARVSLAWADGALLVEFSLGVSGTASLKGDAPVSLGALVERGVIAEREGRYAFTMSGHDSLEFHVAGQIIEVRRAKGRVARVSRDLMAVLALITGLGLLAAWIIATVGGMEPLNLLGK